MSVVWSNEPVSANIKFESFILHYHLKVLVNDVELRGLFYLMEWLTKTNGKSNAYYPVRGEWEYYIERTQVSYMKFNSLGVPIRKNELQASYELTINMSVEAYAMFKLTWGEQPQPID